jgi:hypothetical protein
MIEEKVSTVTSSPEEHLLPFIHADPHAFMALGMYAESLSYEAPERAQALRDKMEQILEEVFNGTDGVLIARFGLTIQRFQ